MPRVRQSYEAAMLRDECTQSSGCSGEYCLSFEVQTEIRLFWREHNSGFIMMMIAVSVP
jgi:hypothetical protein